jgi:hypothetical protein
MVEFIILVLTKRINNLKESTDMVETFKQDCKKIEVEIIQTE